MSESPNHIAVQLPGKTIYLIGTAHISRQSAEEVIQVIRTTKPDTVCVELCSSRLEALKNPEAWRNTDILQILRDGKAYAMLAQLVLASFQKRLAAELQLEAGAEMRAAICAAEEIGAKIELVDRDVKITLKRALGGESIWKLTKLGASLLLSLLGGKEKFSEADIEKIKGKDVLGALLEEVGTELPGLKRALIDERDTYLAAKITRAPGSSIVAVVGAGHLPGIRTKIGEEADLSALETFPPPRKVLTYIAWTISFAILLMIIWGFWYSGAETGRKMVYSWVAATGLLAALGSILAAAHPLTIIVSLLSAPLACLNPAIATGWVAGTMEAILRKPKVGDFETIAEDLGTWRGIYRNRIARVFLIMIFTNLGAALGTIIGGSMIAFLLPN